MATINGVSGELDLAAVEAKLRAPFSPDEIEWKPVGYTRSRDRNTGRYPDGTKAILAAYIDARAVQTRIEEAVGSTFNWSQRVIEVHPGNVVELELTILNRSKVEFGYPNGADDSEPLKSAISDGIKRAAVAFGIGRHLYEMEMQYVPCNEHGKVARSDMPKAQPRPQAARPQQAPAAAAERPVQPVQAQNRPEAPAAPTDASAPASDAPAPTAGPDRATKDQVARIYHLAEQVGIAKTAVDARIAQRYQMRRAHQLTIPEADQIIASLDAKRIENAGGMLAAAGY